MSPAWMLGGLAVAALIAGCGGSERPQALIGSLQDDLPRTPGINILVVSFDALRADHLGVYGYPRPTSPNLDALARKSLVFTRAWSAAQSTPTSFAAMFTGRLPSRVFRGWRLVDGPTIASTFAAGGYTTAFFSNNVQLVEARNFGQGFSHYEIRMEGDDEKVLAGAVSWLRDRPRLPFFLWVHFLSPHSPYDYRPLARHLYQDDYRGRFEQTTGSAFKVDAPSDLARVRDLYDGEIFYGDWLFGRLLEEAEAEGMLDNTLVVVTADHGEELMDHGDVQHSQVYEEIVRVPLIVHHPRAGGGRSIAAPVSSVDLYPTLAAIAGLETSGPTDGVSLLAPIDSSRLRVAIAMTHQTDHYLGAITGDEKVIVDCRQERGSLFDLGTDPKETRDLIRDRPSRYREIVAEVEDLLGAAPCRAIKQAIAGAKEHAGLDALTRRRLQALGYLQGGGEPPPPVKKGDEVLGAVPNPIQVCDGLPVGQTLLRWSAPAPGAYEIHVESPSGKLMARGGVAGEVMSGRWVTDGMEFFLVEAGTGRTVASTRVTLTADGCAGD